MVNDVELPGCVVWVEGAFCANPVAVVREGIKVVVGGGVEGGRIDWRGGCRERERKKIIYTARIYVKR